MKCAVSDFGEFDSVRAEFETVAPEELTLGAPWLSGAFSAAGLLGALACVVLTDGAELGAKLGDGLGAGAGLGASLCDGLGEGGGGALGAPPAL